MLGVEFHELPPVMLTNFKGFGPLGSSWWLVPGHDDLLRTIPALYVQSNLLREHAIYTQAARSNPQVLRVQPPLIATADQVDRFLEALRSTCAEWAVISDCAQAILTKSVGEFEQA
jgi:acetylornithine/succinyldiaminopimelate/putrescine aminotransferase